MDKLSDINSLQLAVTEHIKNCICVLKRRNVCRFTSTFGSQCVGISIENFVRLFYFELFLAAAATSLLALDWQKKAPQSHAKYSYF